MTSILEEQRFDASEMFKIKLETEALVPKQISDIYIDDTIVNTNQIISENNNVETLCKQFCKPVSVSLTKLSTSEIKDLSKTSLCQTQIKRRIRRKKKNLNLSMLMNNSCTVQKRKSIKPIFYPCCPENKVKSPSIAVSRKRLSSKRKQHKKVSLNYVKQPYVKLHRIDKMINKIAQSFAKVISDQKYKINEQEQDVTHTEVSLLTTQLPPLYINREEFHENKTFNTCLNEHLQFHQNIENYNNNIHQINSNQKFKRRNFCDEDSYSENNLDNDLYNINPEETKRFKLDLVKTEPDSFLTIEEHEFFSESVEDAVEEKYSNQLSLQTESYTQLNVPDTLYKYFSKQNLELMNENANVEKYDPNVLENILQETDYSCNDTVEGVEEGCTSKSVPFKIDSNSKSNIYPKLKENNSVNVEKSIVKSNKIQKQTHEPFTLDQNLIQKYKLFTELRVCLVKFDSIKTSFNNKYSAKEIEELIEKYKKSSLNSNFEHTIKQPLSSGAIYLENMIIKSDEPDNFSVTESESISSQSNEAIEDMQNVIEKSFEREYEGVPYGNLEQKLIFEASANASSSVEKACFKSPEFSTLIEHTVNTKKPKSVLHKYSSTKSTSKVLNSSLKERVLDTWSYNEKFEKLISNVRHSKDIEDNKSRVCTTKTSSFKDESLSKNSKKILTTEGMIGFTAFTSLSKGLNAINHRADAKKNITVHNSNIISLPKYKKLIDKEDSNKGNESSLSYKCIVCDHSFEEYSVLQQHLSKHMQRQDNISLILPKPVPLEKTPVAATPQETRHCLEPGRMGLTKSFNEENTLQTVSLSNKNKDKRKLLQKKSQKKDIPIKEQWLNKMKTNLSKKLKPSKACKFTNQCSICLQDFPSKIDLAGHIFLHTESELQEAYKVEKQKLEKMNEEVEEETSEEIKSKTNELVIEKTKDITDKTIHIIEKSSKITDGKDIICSEPSTIQTQDSSLIANSKIRILEKEKVTDDPKPSKLTALNENEFIQIQEFSLQNKVEKEKTNKIGNIKKKYTICQCHNKSESNLNYLQIEVVLLCHICKVLFRSMECFETHYRLPEYAVCNQNRLDSGRSPNLFCASCGMLFSSIVDVREHLQLHIRFKENCTMDFRCNICKVIFIGEGSLFSTHWLKHAKDPFWVASEQSFPKTSVICLKSKKVDKSSKETELILNKFTDTFIHVAENICSNCKLPFVTENDLKIHQLMCKIPNSITNTTAYTNIVVQKHPIIRLICNLCGGNYFDKSELYKHMKNIHKFVSEPQFVCVSLTTVRRVLVCSVCMEISENMEDFEEHWVKHNTNRPYFICTYCEKNCSSLNSFLEHIKEHEFKMKDDIFCKVNYKKIDFICKPCNIGFESEKGLSEHMIIHKVTYEVIKPTTGEVLNQGSSTLIPEINNISTHSKSTELTIEKHKKMSTQKNAYIDNETIENNTQKCLTKSSRDIDKEELINILEGNEEDSEHELIIDLREEPAEECNKLTRKKKYKKKRIAFTPALNASSNVETSTVSKNTKVGRSTENVVMQTPSRNVITTSVVSNKVTQASKNITTSKNAVTSTSSQNITSNQKTSKSNAQVSCMSVNNVNNLPSILSANNEKPVALSNDNLLKPKQGLLRVKTIAELTGNPNSSYSCSCRCNFKCSNDLMQHVLNHTSSDKQKGECKVSEKNQHLQQPSNCTPDENSHIDKSAESKKTQQATNLVPQNISVTSRFSNSPVSQISTTSKECTIQSCATLINDQTSQLQSNTSQEQYSCSSTPTVEGAYHKNLPACNISQRKILPRSSVQRSEEALISNNQNCKQKLQTASNYSEINYVSTSVLQQNPNLISNSSNIYNHIPAQSQQIELDQSAMGRRFVPFHNNNSTIGEMLLVINHTAPTITNIPAVDILQQHGHGPQVYQPIVYNNPIITMDPYMQQSQNVIHYSGSSNYQVATNQYVAPIGENIMTCKITQQPTVELICPYCPKSVSFISEELFNLHVNTYHNIICDICGLYLHDYNELNIHRIKHQLI
ncbi:uncharacterized protein LOC143144060 [Ptiloglossa arizonensis]|uniref:uncharacterized protein LOC143144060 n=1 Tax=Ptiloglossa arizonensis TaxID=3350558 RepID=UPI003FA01C63